MAQREPMVVEQVFADLIEGPWRIYPGAFRCEQCLADLSTDDDPR